MSLLRELYGSRLPQSLYPRSNEEINAYWHDDTETARELMKELEQNEDDVSKPVLPAIVTSVILDRTRTTFPVHNTRDSPLQDLDLDVMTQSNTQTPLSPNDLISIAAADIDEAARNDILAQGSRLYDGRGHLNIDALLALRQTSNGSNRVFRQILVEDIQRRMLSNTQSNPTPIVETDSSLRFLSLLRRVNELHAQQMVKPVEEDGGVPYPQMRALPTFPYTGECSSNTTCTICLHEYIVEEELRILPCFHFYHSSCIDQWLMDHQRCPQCNHFVSIY